jgi:hypothetical protein
LVDGRRIAERVGGEFQKLGLVVLDRRDDLA